MANQNQAIIRKAIEDLFGVNVYVNVSIRDVLLETTDSPLSIWADVDKKKGKIHSFTKKGARFRTPILGLPRTNASGSMMIPVLYQGQKGFIDFRFVKET